MLITYDRYESNNNLKIIYNSKDYVSGMSEVTEITIDIDVKLPKGHVAIPTTMEIPKEVNKLLARDRVLIGEIFNVHKLKDIPDVEKLLKQLLGSLDNYELVETETTYEVTHATGRIKLFKD